MDILKEYQVLTMESPSYLKAIFCKSEKIILIQHKDRHLSENSDECETLPIKYDLKPTEELELTGNPLQVDLNDADDFTNVSLNSARANQWADTEERHIPIDLDMAVTLIDLLNKRKVGKDEKLKLFCVCKPRPPVNTILLGTFSNENTRILVNILGYFSEDDKTMQLENMLKKHQKNCGFNSRVNNLITGVYKIQDEKNEDSLLIETSWDGLEMKPLVNDIKSSKFKLRISVGQANSKFAQFWNELNLIQSLIDLTCDDLTDEETQISNKFVNAEELIAKIRIFCSKPTRLNNPKFADLDFTNLREDDFLDLLWKLLIDCADVQNLKNCFAMLFEECVEDYTMRNKIKDENMTKIGEIIKGISGGTLTVPNLTDKQALLYLIELGLQKLRRDYFYTMNCIDKTQSKHLNNKFIEDIAKFTEIRSEQNVVSNLNKMRITAAPRRTRIQKAETIDIECVTMQINFLSNLHITLQFLNVCMCKYVPEYMQEHTISAVFKNNNLKNVRPFKDIRMENFCDMDVEVNRLKQDFLEMLHVISLNINMSSRKGISAVTTIFHCSTYPIIPRTIFKDYDISASEKEHYYVLEAIEYVR